ncbi:MAG: type I phosphomannose isomerase catalytic subunit [Thermomicrobiales bacterium]
MEPAGPLILHPRLDAKPWGGRSLERFGFALPPDVPIGEAIVTGPDALVREGRHAGRTLGDVVADNPLAALGPLGMAATGGRPLFPLLIKLIDATADLSIQVHPTDEAAAGEDDSLGKTEVWHVLAAEPGSALYLGLDHGVDTDDLAAVARAGERTAHLMRALPAETNTTVLIPAGTVHSLGAGVLVYEVQQPSAITYRLDDWGRVDAAGNPRELHIERALAVTNPDYRPEPITPVALHSKVGRRHLFAACRYFALEWIALGAGKSMPIAAPGSPQAVTCLRGAVNVFADGSERTVRAGSTAALLASSFPAQMRALSPSILLRAWVPYLIRDVVEPGRAAGATDDRLAALAGPLPDVRAAIETAG